MKSIFFLRPKIITLYVIISFVFMSCVSFQNKAPLNKDIEQGQLKNGLSYYLMPHHFPKNRCFLRLNVKVGSFNENNDELGIAHLIEHLAFENRVMGEDKELAVWFQEQGMSFGPDANAYTTIDHTVYHMDLTNCEEQSIKDGLNIMRSFLDSIKFDDALIKKQKLIIDKEQQDYLNNLNKLNKTISHKLFAGTLFDTRPVLGEKAIRDTIDREKLEAFYKKWYRANNAQIVLVGDIDVLQVKELLNQSFMNLKPSTESPALPNVGRPSFQEAVIVASSPEIKSVETIFILQPPSLDMKAPSLDSLKAQLSFELAISMLRESITNKSAKQYPDELSPAEIYGLFGASQLPELSLKVSSNKENQPQVFKRAFSPIKRALDHGFDKAQFKRALDNKLDAIEQSITEDITATSNSWAKAIVDHINQRSIALDAKTIAVTIKATLKKITPKDCSNELKKAFKKSNKYILSLGDLEENEANKTMLAQLLNEVLSSESKPLNPKTSPLEFLYPVKNSSAVVTKKEYFKDIDTHLFTFANNWRLVIKSTALQKDVILFQLDSPRGHASMSAVDLARTELAGLTILTGGLKKHSWQDIINLTKDKMIRMWPRGTLTSLGLNAITRGTDLRFSLELMRAFVTEPDFNETAISQSKSQILVNDQENRHRMAWPLQNSFPAALTHNDIRVVGVPVASIVKVSREELLAWHQQWINNEPATLTVVGDIEVETMLSEVAAVFGSMPIAPIPPKTTFKPITFARGVQRTYEVETGPEASKILIRYALNINQKAETDFLLALTNNIILEALRLKLREEQQSIYTPQVFSSDNQDAILQNTLDIYLSADKKKANQVKQEAIKVVARLASHGVTKSQLDLAKATFLDNVTKKIENTGFWLEIIASNSQALDKIISPDLIPALIEKINTKDINAYLKKYFSPKNASTAIVHSKAKSP